ncbi:MAG: TIGR01212 family radical SAM protein [Bacteroides sp.]
MLPYYYSLNEYLLEHFGRKMYKLALNGGMTCPNRDGLIDTRGCIFCSQGGSGDFAGTAPSITEQINQGKALLSGKYRGDEFIAYFQAYTNTYAPVDYLRRIFMEAVNNESVRILSIATRPDCLSDEICALLCELNMIKPVWIELGLQTTNENSIQYIRRGYDNNTFTEAVKRLRNMHCCDHIIAHMIVGLPKETPEDMLATADFIADNRIDGIKIQLLHVLKGTDLASDYNRGLFSTLSLDRYIDIIEDIIRTIPPGMVVHRITGDGPKNLLIAPMWSSDKKNVLNTMNRRFKEDNIRQGLFRK